MTRQGRLTISGQTGQLRLPLGAQMLDAVVENVSLEAARALATSPKQEAIAESIMTVMDGEALANFSHSAMCAMSLPVRRPKDETAPIIRRDGRFSLIIQPVERYEPIGPDGEFQRVCAGVPFGRHARLILLYVMTQAVRTRSREIYLGSSFSAWLRRMGIGNVSSGGTRGTRRLVQDQLERLMSARWTIRFDGESVADKGRGGAEPPVEMSPFATHKMELANAYAGVRNEEGEFVTQFVLSEAFYENLLRHSVPFNEKAIVALKDSATQMDLYTWLAYRLPRIKPGKGVTISWNDLRKSLGNDTKEVFKFRQTVRDAWETVSGVYQQARDSVDLDDLVVKLRYAPPPLEGHMFLASDGPNGPRIERSKMRKSRAEIEQGQFPLAIDDGSVGAVPMVEALPSPAIRFPKSGALQFSAPDLYEIGRRAGSGNDVTRMADKFRLALGGDIETLEGEALRGRWEAYCRAWKAPS